MCSSIEVRRHSLENPWTYSLLDSRQREIARDVRKGGEGILLLSEVAPVITVGRRTPKEHLLMDETQLSRHGIERIETDRGGLATYHGPGQWVLFPVDRLERLTGDTRGIRKVVHSLLNTARRVAEEFGVASEIREGTELGLWTKLGKIAAVGVHIEDGIVLHGLSLNVFQTPESFTGLKPCGLDSAVDYLGAEIGFEKVGESLSRIAVQELWK